MTVLHLARILPLAVAVQGLRSVTRKTSGVPQAWGDFRTASIREINSDPGWARTGWARPGTRSEKSRKDRQPGPASVDCSIGEAETCPLGAMRTYTKVFPGGKTACGDGTPYYFMVFPGATDKLVIFFQGGGACWSRDTFDMGVCTLNINQPLDGTLGFFNKCPQGNEEVPNPFIGYTVVFLPYCTGDMFLGDRRTDWEVLNFETQETVLAEQRGYRNALAEVDWAKANMRGTLQSLVVSGGSAGAIAAAVFSVPLLASMSYRHATIFIESWVGVFPNDYDATIMQDLGVCTLPIFDGVEPVHSEMARCKAGNLTLVELEVAVMAAFPEVTFAQIQSKFDFTQIFFYRIAEQARQLRLLDDYCGGNSSCDVSLAPKELTQRPLGIPPESFYSEADRLIKFESNQPNYSWYLLAGEYHNFAQFVFGECPDLLYAFAMPGLSGSRRNTLQRWISDSLASTPAPVCEDLRVGSWAGACSTARGTTVVKG